MHLLRFHLRSTIRVTLRNTALQATVTFVLVGLSPDPGMFLGAAAAGLRAGNVGMLSFFGLWCGWNAFMARDPLATTLRGWHRHLPVSAAEERRAALFALWSCQTPVLAFALSLWIGSLVYPVGVPLSPGGMLRTFLVPFALVFLGLGLAAVALPWPAWWLRLPAAAAVVTAVFGASHALPLGACALCLAGLDRTAGRLLAPASTPPRRLRLSGALLPWRLALRAVGAKIPELWLTASLCLAGAWLFLNNNEGLSNSQQALGVRVGGGLALLAVILPLAGGLKERRPPWSWARSLPWSSRRRLAIDASLLAGLALPFLIGAAVLSLQTLAPLLATLIYQVVRLASACRRDAEGITRLGGAAVTEACLVQLISMTFAWSAVAWLVLTPWALRAGARLDQAQKVSSWHERHHFDMGDATV